MVSVIIPTYNRAASLGQAVNSVLTQGCEHLEVIVVDDGSTDQTREVLHTFGDRIRVIQQENGGVSAARNAGMAAAAGEWLGFLDSDDLWRPEKLARQLADLAQCPDAVGHAVDVAIHEADGQELSLFELRGLSQEYRQKPLRERPLLEVLNASFFTQATLLRTDVVRRVGGFTPGMRIHEDIQFLSRVALEGAMLVSTYVGVDLRRVASEAASLSSIHHLRPIESHTNRCTLFSGVLADPRLTGSERSDIRKRLSGARFDLSEAHARLGNRVEARSLRWRSVIDNPGLRSFVRGLVGRRELRPGLVGKGAGRGFRRSELKDVPVSSDEIPS